MKIHFCVRSKNDAVQHPVTVISQGEPHTLKTTPHAINSRCLNDIATDTQVILIWENDIHEINYVINIIT